MEKQESRGTSYNVRGFKSNHEKGIFYRERDHLLKQPPTDMAESPSLEVLKV